VALAEHQHTEPPHQRFLVCRKAFLVVLGIHHYLLDRAVKLFHLKQAVAPHHLRPQKHPSETDDVIAGFILDYRNSACDRVGPDAWLSKSKWEDVFAQFQVLHGVDFCSYEEFCRVRKARFPHISLHKRSTLPHCDNCTQYRELLEEDLCDKERGEVEESKATHDERVDKERVFMHSNEDHCELRPSDRNMAFVDYTPPIAVPHYALTPSV
jgi:hypothetical protein